MLRSQIDRRSKFEEMRRKHYAGMADAIFDKKDPNIEEYLKSAAVRDAKFKEALRREQTPAEPSTMVSVHDEPLPKPVLKEK